MNIKSLLIGSAAALATVTGAQAADAVVAAEPEPMEYVRVCDAYGTGYFYIPGTETCLKIGGRFRYEKTWAKGKTGAAAYDHSANGRIIVETKNDSEWGTVWSYIQIQGGRTNNLGNKTGVENVTLVTLPTPGIETTDVNAHTTVEFEYKFGIGPVEFGDAGNKFDSFGGGRTDDGGKADARGRTQYIAYTQSFDSITAVLSLEHDRNDNFDPAATTDGKDNKYMPDVVGGLSATFGDWYVGAVAAYDESDDSVAIKKKVTGDFGMFGVTLVGLYANSATNRYFDYDGFSMIAGVSAQVTDSISLAGDVQYWDNEDWKVIGDINWNVATGFSVLLEGTIDQSENKTAMLRFQRKF